MAKMWHKDLIDVLPYNALTRQWEDVCMISRMIERESSAPIMKKIKEYPIEHFETYLFEVFYEMHRWDFECSREQVAKTFRDFKPKVRHDMLYDGWFNRKYLTENFFDITKTVPMFQEEYDEMVERMLNLGAFKKVYEV